MGHASALKNSFYFVRGTVNLGLQAVLHPLSVARIDTRTGKVISEEEYRELKLQEIQEEVGEVMGIYDRAVSDSSKRQRFEQELTELYKSE